MKDEIERSFADEEGKRIVKEAIKEWLDQQLIQVGKWSLTGIAAAMLAAIAYLILTSQGWHK